MFKVKNRCMEDEPGAGGGDGVTVKELQAEVALVNEEKTKMAAKMDELLGEAKKAKKARDDADRIAKEAKDEKAKADGDHEQLYKSAMTELEKERAEKNDLLGSIANKELKSESFNIASSMAENIVGGAQNATLLSNEIKQRLKYVDGDLRVTDLSGNLTVSTLEDLKTEFKNNPDYSGLLKGNQSSGGGASSGSNSGGAAKTMTRADFDALDPARQMKFMQSGGKTI